MRDFRVQQWVEITALRHIDLARPRLWDARCVLRQVSACTSYGRGDRTRPYQGFRQARHCHLCRGRRRPAGLSGARSHDFGFRLVSSRRHRRAIAEVERVGGRLLRRGEFAPGLPTLTSTDPDGYED